MKKKGRTKVLVGVCVVLVLALTLPFTMAYSAPAPVEVPRFGLADIPEIENKRPVSLIVESEAGMRLMPPVFEEFLEHTGVSTAVDTVLFAAMYGKINIELIGGTGAYDVVIVESSSTNEWAPYLFSLEELAENSSIFILPCYALVLQKTKY